MCSRGTQRLRAVARPKVDARAAECNDAASKPGEGRRGSAHAVRAREAAVRSEKRPEVSTSFSHFATRRVQTQVAVGYLHARDALRTHSVYTLDDDRAVACFLHLSLLCSHCARGYDVTARCSQRV